VASGNDREVAELGSTAASRRGAGVSVGFGVSGELLHVGEIDGEVSYEAKYGEGKKGCTVAAVTIVGRMVAVPGRFCRKRRVSSALVH
jgi:hypothetical protein